MSIPESTFAKWSHHEAGTAFKQAHVPIREALEAHKGLSQFKYEVFLQGSYKNDTNLGGDSDVDVVVRLSSKLKPVVAALTGERLQEDGSHKFVYQQWKSFRDEALKALRSRFGKAAKSGRKTLKVPKAGSRRTPTLWSRLVTETASGSISPTSGAGSSAFRSSTMPEG